MEDEQKLTPEEQKEVDAMQARIDLLKADIEILVADLVKKDYTVEELGYATDLFKTWLSITLQCSEQFDAFIKGKKAAEGLYYKVLSKDLVKMKYDEKPAEKTQA